MRSIQILRCNGLTDEDPFGHNDPFVIITDATNGDELYRTPVKEEEGSTVSWASAICELKEEQGPMVLKVFDKDVAADDLIGETVELTIPASTNEQRLELNSKDGERTGLVFIRWVIDAVETPSGTTDDKPAEVKEEEKVVEPEAAPEKESEDKPEEKDSDKPENPEKQSEDDEKPKEAEPKGNEETKGSEGEKEETPGDAPDTNEKEEKVSTPKAVRRQEENEREPEPQKAPKTETPARSPEKKKQPKQRNTPVRQHNDESGYSSISRTPSPAFAREEVYSRLSNQPERIRNPTPLPPLVNTRMLSPEEERNSIQRLYNQSCERKKHNLERLDRQLYGDSTGEKKTVDVDTLDAIVNRFYQGAKDHDQAIERRRGVYFKKYASPVKTFKDKDEEKDAVDRLSNTAAKEKERADALFEKFNPPKSFVRRTRDEIADNAKRYFDGGFGRKR